MIPNTPKYEFWRGVRDEAPILLGVAPFGLIFGALAINAAIAVPAAQAMSSIILPELATRNAALDLSLRNPQLYAGALAVLFAWRTKNVLLTIIVGMAALLLIQAVMGMA